MKKTMIALAAVAAAGAASAQVTLGGEFAWGYGNYNTAGVDSSGGGIDTSQVSFTQMKIWAVECPSRPR